MKVTPHTDYPVRVRPRQWEEDGPSAPFYTGIYDVVLNTMVTVSFVPDLGTAVLDPAALPADPSTVRTQQQARLDALLFAQYAVTPNPQLAGSTTLLPVPPGQDATPGVVFYVQPAEFERLAEDLTTLDDPDARVSDLRGHPAIDVVERIVSSPEFADADAYWLRDDDGR